MDLTISLFLIVIGTLAIFGFVSAREKSRELLENGVVVKAVINKGRTSRQGYILEVKFVTRDENRIWITGEIEIGTSIFKLPPEEGDDIEIIYNSENPNEFDLNSTFTNSGLKPYLFLIVGGFMFLLGLYQFMILI